MKPDFSWKLSQMALAKQLPFLYLIMFFTGTMVLGAEPKDLTVTQVIKTKVDVGMAIKGEWGTFINGKSYQQMPLDTHKGWPGTSYPTLIPENCSSKVKILSVGK